MTTPAAESAGGTHRALVRLLLPAGVGIAGAGVALAIAGVIAAPLFVPGTWIILAGVLVLAAAGVTGVTEARGDAG